MCPSQPLILNFLSRLIQILERARLERKGGDRREREDAWERGKPFVAGGGSDLAKLKSLLYERAGKIGYTRWISMELAKTGVATRWNYADENTDDCLNNHRVWSTELLR